jgi:hypothetical protein
MPVIDDRTASIDVISKPLGIYNATIIGYHE